MTFNRETLLQIRNEMAAALAAVEAKHGIKFDLEQAPVRFNSTEFRMNLTCSTVSDSGVSTKLESIMRAFGMKMTSSCGRYTLIGYEPRKHKYPFIYRDNRTGKTFKCGQEHATLFFRAG